MNNQLNLFNGIKSIFFNTNESEEQEVEKKLKTFQSQEKSIFSVFIKSGHKWSVSQMHEQLLASGMIKQGTPKGSIGRGFTNLQNDGRITIIKGDLVKGAYGASEHYYELTDKYKTK